MTVTSPTERMELSITGMTCACCANRVERKLNKLDGVTASVNYATATATVEYDAGVAIEQLVAAVEDAGYGAVVPAVAEAEQPEPFEADPAAALRQRLIVSALLSIPVLLVSMISPLQFDNWQWLSLQMVTGDQRLHHDHVVGAVADPRIESGDPWRATASMTRSRLTSSMHQLHL